MAQSEGGNAVGQNLGPQGQEDIAQRSQQQAQGQHRLALVGGENAQQHDAGSLDDHIQGEGRSQAEIVEQIDDGKQAGQTQQGQSDPVTFQCLQLSCH